MENNVVVREFLFGEDGNSLAAVSGEINEYTFESDGTKTTEIVFNLSDGSKMVQIYGSVDTPGEAIQLKQSLDKIACVLRTLRDRVNAIAYPDGA